MQQEFTPLVSIQPDFPRLCAVFENGEQRTYDITPLYDRIPIFKELQNQTLFNRVQVDAGGYGIIWNDDIDLAAEELYYNGTKQEETDDE